MLDKRAGLHQGNDTIEEITFVDYPTIEKEQPEKDQKKYMLKSGIPFPWSAFYHIALAEKANHDSCHHGTEIKFLSIQTEGNKKSMRWFSLCVFL